MSGADAGAVVGDARDPEFDEFVAAQLVGLHRFALGLVGGDREEAWDLVQDSLIRLAAAWATVDCGRNPAAYARTILVRQNLNRLRRLRRETQAHLRLAGMRPSSADGPVDDPGEWVGGALRALPPRQRTALVLVHGWGFGIGEAAGVMGCSPNSVKTHLSRGMARLRSTTASEREA